jgi:hypothetical protein
MMPRLAPYGLAIAGAVAVTAAIGLVSTRFQVPGLSAFYLLLVLWLGATWGRGAGGCRQHRGFPALRLLLRPACGDVHRTWSE